jgi:cell surface protein SprA
VEPLPEFRIDLTAQRTFGDQYSSTYRYSTGRGPDTAFGEGFRHFSPQQLQNFTMSWWAFNSAFENSPEPEFKSVVYDLFRANRLIFSDRLASQHALDNPGYVPTYISDPDSSRYGYDGFSVIQQDVLVRSFLSAYGGDPAATASLGAITSGLPRPNWKVNYTGLQNIEWVKRNFTSVALSHGYTGNLTATGIQTNMLRAQKLEDNPLNPFPRNDNSDVLPELQIGQISMSENFSPLVGVQVRTKSNATFKMDINRSRQIAMSLANNQFNETKSRDVTVGVGYIIPDVKFTVVDQAGGRTQVKSNLELKLDVKFNDNQTVIRKILEDFVQPTAGQRRTTIKFTADYRLSRRLTAQAYYDQSASRFKTGNAFPTSQVQAGFAFKLNLGG